MLAHFAKCPIDRYFLAAAVVGAARKTVIVHKATIKTNVYDPEGCVFGSRTVPLIACDKVFVTLVGTFLYVLYAPVYVVKDLRHLEMVVRRVDCESDWMCHSPKDMWGYLIA
jgi:hypothetical protein